MRYTFKWNRQTTLLICACVLLVALVVTILLTPSGDTPASSTSGGEKLIPIYCVDTPEKKVALSFDVAWDDDHTGKILDILDEYNVKATFFPVGIWVDKNPDMLKEIVKRGHAIGNHTDTHPHMNQLSEGQIKKELADLDKKMYDLTQVKTNLFRAPFGEYNNTVVKTCNDMGYEVIQWDVDTCDWMDNMTPADILARVQKRLKNGSIILCHNNAKTYDQYLPSLIEYVQTSGYAFVLIQDLILQGDTYIDHTGMQHLKETPTFFAPTPAPADAAETMGSDEPAEAPANTPVPDMPDAADTMKNVQAPGSETQQQMYDPNDPTGSGNPDDPGGPEDPVMQMMDEVLLD